MRWHLRALLAVLLCGGIGCADRATPGLPVVSLDAAGGFHQQVSIPDNYGVIIDWPGPGLEPSDPVLKPDFYLFDHAGKSRRKFDDYGQFLAALGRIPSGSKIYWIDKCTVPFTWGMPAGKWPEFTGTLQRSGLELVEPEESFLRFCYCEYTFTILFDETVPPKP